MKIIKTTMQRVSCLFLLIGVSGSADADPWFTGPLLALPGQTVPRGHIDASLMIPTALSNAIYNSDWRLVAQPHFNSTQIAPEIIYGLADRVDLQYDGTYMMNENDRRSHEHLGDTSVTIGYQALTQANTPYSPDLRITLQEVIPTGLYDNLTPANNGTEATGTGSYQSAVGFNFQYLASLSSDHYLNTHASVTYTHAAMVALNGISTYGGTQRTKGRIKPGDSIGIDLACELTLTQQWVLVLEGNAIYQQASKFYGQVGARNSNDPLPLHRISRFSVIANRLFPSRHNIGRRDIGSGNLDQFTLAPAIEYNFSANYGIIAGAWFTVAGKNTPAFFAPMITLNAYW